MVKQNSNGMIEQLSGNCKTCSSYYNTKNDNLLFGITMDCKCDSDLNFYKLYRVDVGMSRGFDVFSNYKSLIDDIEYLKFFESDFSMSISTIDENDIYTTEYDIYSNSYNTKFNEVIEIDCDTESIVESVVEDSESDSSECQIIVNNDIIETTKKQLIQKFLNIFISRIPQVLQIDKNEISIIRATLKNIYRNQPRLILHELSKNAILMKIIDDGGL
jgi:hypothetical protein